MKRDTTNWKCDGCGSQVQTALESHPAGWRGVGFCSHPEGAVVDRKHVCQSCMARVMTVLDKGSTKEQAS